MFRKKSNKSKNKQVLDSSFFSPLKTSIIILTVTIIIIVGISSIIYFRDLNNENSSLISSEHNRIHAMRDHLHNVLYTVGADLHIVASHADFSDYFENENQESLDNLSGEYLEMSLSKKVYDQIRYLDLNGMEIIRVNYNFGSPQIVDSSDIQNKKGRYYFDDTFNLEYGEIFISPFDLNVEHGEIEQPLKPMLRVGTPILDKNGEKKGIVLLNYLGNNLLESMDRLYQGPDSKLLLSNQNGFWMKALNKEDEWGFMYEDRSKKDIQHFDSELWLEVLNNSEGQIKTEKGLFTYIRVNPLKNISEYQNYDYSERTINKQLSDEEQAWIIISFVPQDKISQKVSIMFDRLLIIDTVLFIIILILVLRLNQAMRSREKAEKIILELNNLMRIINKILRHDILGKLGSIRACIEASELVNKNDLITDAYKASKDGIKLVNNMKELEGSFSVDNNLEKYNLGPFIKNIAVDQKIKIEITGDAVVMADSALSSVFENIIRNAKIHAGVKLLTIKIEETSKKVKVRIFDQGKGLDGSIKDSIFQEGVKSSKTGNTGIGLYVTKKTINRYGGSIRAEANHPKGTVFIIEFPLV